MDPETAEHAAGTAGLEQPPANDAAQASAPASEDESGSSSDASSGSSSDSSSSASSSSGSSGSASESDDGAAARGRTLAQRRKRLMRAKFANKYAEDAAVESDGEGGSVDSDEGSGSESPGNRAAAGYELDGVVVADEDASDESGSSETGTSDTDTDSGVDSDDDVMSERSARPRRLKRLAEKGMLDEEDYALLAEAAERGEVELEGDTLENVNRYAKRARRADGAEESAEGGAAVPPAGAEGEEPAIARRRSDDEEYDSEGLDEFIVRDHASEEEAEEGAGTKRRRPRISRATAEEERDRLERAARFDRVFGRGARQFMLAQQQAATEAQPTSALSAAAASLAALYGDEDDEDDFGTSAPRRLGAEYADDEEFDEDDEEGRARTRPRPTSSALQAVREEDDEHMGAQDAKAALLQRALEPAVLAAHLIRNVDLRIRDTDEPERLQTALFARRKLRRHIERAASEPNIASVARSLAVESADRDSEATWIAERLLLFPNQNVISPDYDLPATAVSLLADPRTGGTTPSTSEVEDVVKRVLGFVYDDKLEVPFIWTYKRDYLLPTMGYSHLWYILDLDEAWVRIISDRVATGRRVDRAVSAQACDPDTALRIRQLLLSAPTARKVEDATRYANIALVSAAAARGIEYDPNTGAVNTNGTHTAASGTSSRQDLYKLAQASEVRRVALRVFLPAESLAANLAAGAALHAVPDAGAAGDAADALSTLAFDALSPEFSSEDAVLRGARHIAATELAAEPYIRATLRRLFFERATVSTVATAKGSTEIDASHQYFGIHTLKGKRLFDFGEIRPIEPGRGVRAPLGMDAHFSLLDDAEDDEHPPATFELATVPITDGLGLQSGFGSNLSGQRVRAAGRTWVRLEPRVGGFAQYAVLLRARGEGFIDVRIGIDDTSISEMINLLLVFYLSPAGLAYMNEPATSLSAFDQQRRAAVEAAVRKLLIPAFTSEAEEQLARVAHEAVAAEYACALRRRVMMAPPVPPPQPLRKRKDEGEAAGSGGAEPEHELMVKYPWQRLRPRVMSVAVSRHRDREDDAVVAIDHRGEVLDHVQLQGDRDRRSALISEFMFSHAPDIVVISASAGLRARDVRASVVQGAMQFEGLVRRARANYKRRRALVREHGPGAGTHEDPRVRQEWESTMLAKHLEPLAERWTIGRYRYLKPRTPDTSVLQHAGPRGAVPEDPNASLPVLMLDDEIARAYATSNRGKAEFPDHPTIVRTAISLGRGLQDPLAEVAYMWARRADLAGPGVAAAMRAGVTAVPEDLLAAQLHPLQRDSPPHLLYLAAERVMVEVANGTGIDFNFAASAPHMQPLLQFICGLGPRKLGALLSQLPGRAGRLRNRSQLQTRGLLSPTVYKNAIGFLRVLPPGKEQNPAVFAEEGESMLARAQRRDVDLHDAAEYDPLDATRIHPEHYLFALQICKDGDDTPAGRPEVVTEDPSTYLELVRDVSRNGQEALARMLRDMFQRRGGAATSPLTKLAPEWDEYSRWAPGMRSAETGQEIEPAGALSTLDLNGFATILAEAGFGKMLHILQLIVAELRAPFRDARRPFQPPSAAAIFRMLTGESTMQLRPGVVVPARIMNVTDRRVRALLDNGLSGFIGPRNVQVGVDFLASYVPGNVMNATVVRVDRRGFAVELAPLDDGALALSSPPIVDAACDVSAALALQQRAAQEVADAVRKNALESGSSGALLAAQAAGAVVAPRGIAHPLFKNVLRHEAEVLLTDRPVYECLFRPSSKGTDHLTITWKIADPNVCVHLDVTELNKAGLDPGALGRTLRVDGREYSDLDEIVARHIEAMAFNHRQLRSIRIFRDAPQAAVDAELRQRIEEDPSRIPYLISPCTTHIGTYRISYILHSRPHHETVRVLPDGYEWRRRVSPTWQKLIDDFKARCRQRPDAAAGTADAGRASGGAPRRSRFDTGPASAGAAGSRWGPAAGASQQGGPNAYQAGAASAAGYAAGTNGYGIPQQQMFGYEQAVPPAGGVAPSSRFSRWA